MEEQFIYVFSKKERDILKKAGYSLLKSDEEKEIYIFSNKYLDRVHFSNVDAVYSNVLTF